jgi:hypothetical protein
VNENFLSCRQLNFKVVKLFIYFEKLKNNLKTKLEIDVKNIHFWKISGKIKSRFSLTILIVAYSILNFFVILMLILIYSYLVFHDIYHFVHANHRNIHKKKERKTTFFVFFLIEEK